MRWGWLRFLFYGGALLFLSLRLFGGDGADAEPSVRLHDLKGTAGHLANVQLSVENERVQSGFVNLVTWCDAGKAAFKWAWWELDETMFEHRGERLTARISNPRRRKDGRGAHYVGWLTGTISDDAERASGKLRMVVRHTDRRGRETATCDSGDLSWSATR